MSAMPIDPLGRDFAYLQVAEDLARRISAGEFTRRVPAKRALAGEYQVCYATMRHAMAVLRDRGIIRRTPGARTWRGFSGLRRGTAVGLSSPRDHEHG